MDERVAWNEWGPDAFRRAEGEGKLVFLDISATWCHWCHVLDGTSLSDPRVVRLLSDAFVPVRVDTDRRPDVNERYNQGGWPTTAVLLPDGRLLAGATYLPPDDLYRLLSRCERFYRDEGERVEAYLRDHPPVVPENPAAAPPGGPGDEDLPRVKHAVLGRYDPLHPGFFREPKFLMTEALSFLRDARVLEADAEAGATFLAVLERMARSGVFDPVEGGFFRYATRRDWTEPHYEKLLADNAEMLSLCVSAYELSGERVHGEAARMTLRFLLRSLYDPGRGVFHASRDADEAYYSLPAEERARRSPPGADRTAFAEYNAKAVTALLDAHRALPGAENEGGGGRAGSLPDLAERLGAFLMTEMWTEADGQVRFREGGEAHAGQLADNVEAAIAMLDLWEATGKAPWFEHAGRILDWTVRHLFHAASFAFLDRRVRENEPPGFPFPIVPFAQNARAAIALMRYARDAYRTDLFAVAEMTLARLSSDYADRSLFAAPYGSALLRYRRGRTGKACIPGDPSCDAGERKVS